MDHRSWRRGWEIHVSANLTAKKDLGKLENQLKSNSQGFQIPPRSSSKAIVLQRMPSNLHFVRKFAILKQFLSPKKKEPKLKKNHEDGLQRKKMFWETDFDRIFFAWVLENWAKRKTFAVHVLKKPILHLSVLNILETILLSMEEPRCTRM